jgi:Arc/MetJ-type ribon-helix-helix transcriptional regulator
MSIKSHHVTLSEPASAIIEAVVSSGRYKDFSAAVQDAVWKQFMGERAVFDEYGLTPAEVERSAQKDLAAIRRDRKAGKLKTWRKL